MVEERKRVDSDVVVVFVWGGGGGGQPAYHA
jgi:hypothetical protein